MKKGFTRNIEQATKENTDFARVLYTGEQMQLALMALLPGSDIGLETHPANDQFFRFESGEGKVVVNDSEYLVGDGDCVIVPCGSQHNVINTSETESLKFYTLYAPPHHRDGLVHATKAHAEACEVEFDGAVTEQ